MDARGELRDWVHQKTTIQKPLVAPTAAPDTEPEAPRGIPSVGDEILSGKYTIERVIGEGGMGVVMAAMHKQLGGRVAFKFLTDTNAKLGERFLREGRAAVQIGSEHVARVLDAGVLESGVPYLMMEHLSGADLSQYVAERGALPIADAIELVLQTCAGLAAAHQAGIVHRDLKPSNLFLTTREDGSPLVKVLDFGISKAASGVSFVADEESLTNPGTMLGSPPYMAPEQIRDSKDVDHRVDIWAIGLVLHELVTGRPMFEGTTVLMIYKQILSDDPPPRLRAILPDAPEALERIILRCVDKDASRRYATVSELAADLAALAPRAAPRAQLGSQALSRGSGGAIPKAYTTEDGEGTEDTALVGPRGEALVAGRYAIYDEIAAGGTASVRFGRQFGRMGFARTVAVKCLRDDLARDTDFAARFVGEARLASRIQHPNVVTTLDVVAEAGKLYLVMEYVAGDALSHLLRACTTSNQRPPLRVILSIVTDALQGLHAAHEATDEHGQALVLVHRDVSPQNILVGVDGVARVVDFGIAKATARAQITDKNIVEGKAPYLTPEQLTHGPIDRRTDVFAASVVLWEALTGISLFGRAETTTEILAHVLSMPIPPPSGFAPVDPAIDAIVLRGLARDPHARFPTAKAMAEALENATTLARPSEVGAWVRSCNGATLEARAARVRDIESGGALVAPRAPAARDVPTDLLGAADRAPSSPSLASSSTPSLPSSWREPPSTRASQGSRRLLLTLVGVGAAIGIAGAIATFVWTQRRAIAPPTPAGTPSAEASARAVVATEPSVTPPPSAPTIEPGQVAPSATAVAPTAGKHTSGPPRTRASHDPRPNCNPPYTLDENGVKRFKVECVP